MRKKRWNVVVMIAVFLAAGVVGAQEADSESADSAASVDAPTVDQGQREAAPSEKATPVVTVSETTVSACTDGADNDGDGAVDCADSECAVFAVCVASAQPVVPRAPLVAIQVESGRLCRDGVDNDGDGAADCYDVDCHGVSACRKVIYERPESPDRPMGLFVTGALGIAFPNFRWKRIRVDSDYGDEVLFDPDMGSVLSLQLGYAPVRFFGFGMLFNGAFTQATNRATLLSLKDDPDKYRYIGQKVGLFVGGFVRMQFPTGRINPFLDVAMGYSAARYTWHVYDARTDWSDIAWDDDSEDYDARYKQGDHATLALQPGFDVFVARRLIAVGTRVWLPVWASSGRGMDNIGVLFQVTFTPGWREPLQLKPAYARAAAGQ